MADRKKTPNILGDLLGGGTPASAPLTPSPAPTVPTGTESQQSDLPVKQQNDLPAKETAIKSGKQGATLLVRQHGGEPASRYPVKSAPTEKRAILKSSEKPAPAVEAERNDEVEVDEEVGAKVKVTFYLSEDAVDALDEAQSKLRRLSRTSNRKLAKSVTSKSALLEEAVRLVCQDLEENGVQSQIARKLF